MNSQLTHTVTYKLAGLQIISELPLQVLAPCCNELLTGDEVTIRRAHVPDHLASVNAVLAEAQCNENELLLNIPGVARYLLRGGREILVDQVPHSSYGDVCAYLLGTVFGILAHQRGIPPLHASAIDVADGCVAFVGSSGAGKSTLAAALAARGHQVISDDVCFLEFADNGNVQVWPGIARIRLWENSIAALPYHGPRIQREFQGDNKYVIPVDPPQDPIKPRRLRRVYQLRATANGTNASVKQLYGAAAMEVMMQNIYRINVAERMGYKTAAFSVCAAATRSVPVLQFNRPMNFNVLHEGIEFLETHLRETYRSF